MKQLVYYDVAEGVVPELVADLPLQAMEYGQFKSQVGLRPGPAGVVKRGGMVALTSAGPVVGGTFIGGGLFEYGSDTLVKLTAVVVSAVVRIYAEVYTFSTDTWGAAAESTAASGKWGNTRMTVPVLGLVQFQAVPGQDGTQAVLVQNGIDAARIVDLGVRDARIVQDVQPADYAQAYSPLFSFLDTLPVASTAAAGITITDSASAVGSIVTSGSVRHWRAVFTLTDVAEFVEHYVTASSIDGRDSFGLMLFVKATDDNWRGALKISAVVDDDAGSVKAISLYDPSTQFVSMAEAATVDEGVVLVQLPIQEHPDADIDEIKGIRIEVVAAGLAAGYTFDIRGVAVTGNTPGFAQYGISLKNSGTFTESPGAPYRVFNDDQNVDEFRERNRIARLNEGRVPRGAAVGFEDVFTDGPYFFMPVQSDMYYNVELPVFAPISTEGARGVDTACIYRKDPGSKSFSFVAEVAVATYNVGAAAWQTVTPLFATTTSWKARAVYEDNAKSAELEEKRRLPDSQALAVQIGFAMGEVDKRVMVGVARGAGSPIKQNALMVSEEDRPMMFRPFPRFEGGLEDASSGYLIALGDENVMAVRSGSASGLGSNSAYVWTNRKVRAVVGFKAYTIAGMGTVAADSVSEHGGVFFWMDQQNVMVAMASSPEAVSLFRVQTLFDDTPDAYRKYYSGLVGRDLVYMARTPLAGTYNTRAVVYSQYFQKYVSEDKKEAANPTKFPQKLMHWHFFGGYKVVGFSRTGQLFEYDVADELEDDGDGIEVQWDSGAVCAEFNKSAVYGRMGVFAQATSESLATDRRPVRKAAGSHAQSVGTLSLVSANPFAEAFDVDSAGNPPAMRDYGCGGRLSGTLSEEFVVTKWVQYVRGVEGDGAS